MTEVPSPQEELRTAIAAAVYAEYCKLPVDRYPHQDKVAAALLPLFAARVAAIEARRDEVGRMAAEATVRASKAEADLAAMTTKADTYQRMYYAEHGEIAAELDRANSLGKAMTIGLGRAADERDAALAELAEMKWNCDNLHHGVLACAEWEGELAESKLIAATLYDELQQLRAELTAMHSWNGLMSLLDEHWPADIFPMLPDTENRDPGPRINSLLRWVDKLRADLTAMTAERDDAIVGWDALRAVADQQRADLAAAEARALGAQRASIDMSVMVTRAEERVAAERKQAAAQAWDEGQQAYCDDIYAAHSIDDMLQDYTATPNPYRAAEVPATPEEPPATHEFVRTQSTNVCGHWFGPPSGPAWMCSKYDNDPIHGGEATP